MTLPYVLAITGASGAIYAVRLLQSLALAGAEVHLTISASGQAVIEQELGVKLDLNHFQPADLLAVLCEPQPTHPVLRAIQQKDHQRQHPPATAAQLSQRVTYSHHADFLAPIASGSFRTAAMVVCPCSGSTLSGIAHGASQNLIQRAAEVHLKERRKLIVVPRETPVSSFQLENMKRLADAGGIVLPAMPGWYHGVESLADLLDFVVARVLDQLAIEHTLTKRWGTDNGNVSIN